MTGRLPPLESLRVLEACVRRRNFTRAAGELGVTPAAVSLRIRDLEAELGRPLFRRAGPRVTPTEAGLELAAQVARALGLIGRAVEDCRGTAEPLRVAAAPSFAARWLAPRLPRWHARPDAVPIELDVSVEVRAPRDFDLAVRTGPGPWPGLDARPLLPVELTPMLSPALAAAAGLRAPADLARLPLLPHPDWPAWFAACGAAPGPLRFYADDYPTNELVAAAALQGAGAALLSPILFGGLVEEGRLLRPFADTLTGRGWHWLATREGEARPAVLALRDWLIGEAEPDGR